MSNVDPVAALFADLDRPLSPRPEFERALRARLLTELRTPASTRAVWRSFSDALPPIRSWTRLRLALVLIALFLLLAGVATATYLVGSWGGGVVSTLNSPANGVDSISGVGPDGKVSTTWRCPRDVFCGDLVSAAWAPDGRRIAFSLTEFGGHSSYPGLHVVDTLTGRDQHMIGAFSQGPAMAAQRATWLRQARAYIQRYGCLVPDQLSWSPDGSKIAYACAVIRNGFISSDLHIVNADGSRPRVLRTGTPGAAWPSWSPDGTRIAFSAAADPREHVRTNTTQPDRVVRSSVYTIQLNGAHRQLVVKDAAAPAWSPRWLFDRLSFRLRASSTRHTRRTRRDAGRQLRSLLRHRPGRIADLGSRRHENRNRHEPRRLPRRPRRNAPETGRQVRSRKHHRLAPPRMAADSSQDSLN